MLALAVSFILITRLALSLTLTHQSFRDIFDGTEATILIGFFIGGLIQFTLVGLMFAAGQQDVKAAIMSLKEKAPAVGWQIALTVAAVDIIFVAGGWLDQPDRIIEASQFALAGSLIPAFDGFSQEVIFRGFILLRLQRAKMTGWLPIVLSGLAFALLHLGYGNSFEAGIGAALAPILGTFGLGMAWAYAFRLSNYKLGPVVAAHVLVILILQPWLALSYAG